MSGRFKITIYDNMTGATMVQSDPHDACNFLASHGVPMPGLTRAQAETALAMCLELGDMIDAATGASRPDASHFPPDRLRVVRRWFDMVGMVGVRDWCLDAAIPVEALWSTLMDKDDPICEQVEWDYEFVTAMLGAMLDAADDDGLPAILSVEALHAVATRLVKDIRANGGLRMEAETKQDEVRQGAVSAMVVEGDRVNIYRGGDLLLMLDRDEAETLRKRLVDALDHAHNLEVHARIEALEKELNTARGLLRKH